MPLTALLSAGGVGCVRFPVQSGENLHALVGEVLMSGLGHDLAGAGDPTLLFLHGWCGNRSFFAPQCAHFSKTHRVVAVDLPAHGTSEVPNEYSIEAFANDVGEFARGLHLGPSVVFGHSIGAMVALALERQSPDLVDAVALIDPPPLSKEVWKGFSAQLISSFQGPDGPAGRRQFVEQMFLPTDDPARRAQIIETMTAVPNDIAIPLVRAIAAFDAMAALRECKVPVLTISSAVPTNDAASLLEANPSMTIGQTVGAGHFLMLEVPEQVNPMIERFLAVIPGGSLAAH
jgi:pimeloyl-ACP methyl ester carboxylesterase